MYFRKIKIMGDIFEILKEKLAAKSEKVGGGGVCIYWKGGGRDGYGILRVGWPVDGSKVEKVHREALMVEMRLTRSVSRCRLGGQPSLP